MKTFQTFFGVLFVSVVSVYGDSTQLTTSSLAAGQNQAMALRSDGSVWTWGTNLVGEMGIANLTNTPFPMRVPGISNVVGIGAGWTHSLAVDATGAVWAWGTNNGGQLGNGTTTASATPVQVTRITNAIAVSAGQSHSLALLANGRVMAWGTNAQDQLGTGNSTSTNQPVFVLNLTNIVKVVAGGLHNVALDANGVVWSWGYGAYGQMGRGTTGSSNTPSSCLSNVVDIAAGAYHTIALKKDGTVWVWGNNQNGQLGAGSVFTSTNVPSQVGGISGALAIGAGFYESAATLSTGQNLIWGFQNGALTVPTQLSPAPPFVKYALGTTADSKNFCFGMATNGAVWAFGVNLYGQFGNNNTMSPFSGNVEIVPTLSFAPTPPATWGEFLRGNTFDFNNSAHNLDFCSIVVPVDLEQGVALNRTGSDAYCFSNQIPWFLCIQKQTLYVPDSLISSTTNLNIFAIDNPAVAFGSQASGSPLYVNQPYRFGVYAGGLDESTDAATNVIRISVYDRTLFNGSSTNIAPLNTFNIPLPRRTIVADSNAWTTFLINGAATTFTSNGLTTTVEFLDNGSVSNKPFGLTWLSGHTMTNFILTGYKLTHTASATNYFYKVEVLGKVQVATSTLSPMATNASGTWTPTPLYTLDFSQPSPLHSIYVDRLFFQGTPMPPTYEEAAVAGPTGLNIQVTNQFSLTNTVYTNVDASPELRRHPVLDQFVLDMNKDPLALASYVINEIELTDPFATGQSNSVVMPTVTCGGVDRSALGTFLEGQGSPIEQCELLVYLLRQAGYPAAYVFPTNNNLLMSASHISQLWRTQVKGVLYPNGIPVVTNSLLTVNYPWVVVNIGTNTYHIYPWIKDTEIVEGVNFYDYMPTNYNTALAWVEQYVRANTNILNLDPENVVSKLFPATIQQYLNPLDPSLSLDNLGVRAINRRHQFPTWSYLPQPDAVTNASTVALVDSLTNTSSFSFLANMFNTARVQVFSNSPPSTLLLDTGNWNSCDFHDRKMLLFTNNSVLSLWLAPYTSNVTTVQAFSAGLPSSTAIQSNSVPTNGLTNIYVQVIHHRQVASLTHPYTLYPVSDSPASTNVSKCILGDVAAVAMDFGRVTPAMLQQHAETYWGLQRQRAANTNFIPTIWDYKGTAAYLLGMSYYQKCDAFDALNQQWHKMRGLVNFASGLGIIGVCPTATNMQAKVDMFTHGEVQLANGSLRPDSGVPTTTVLQNYFTLSIVANSSQEHDIIQTMFPDQNAVSTVRLLQLAQQRATNGNSPILELVNNNVVSAGGLTYTGYPGPLKSQDASVWTSVTNIFTQSGGDYARVLITPGFITNAPKTYIGMGALIFSAQLEQALISGNSATLNGGWGSEMTGFNTPPGGSADLTWNLNSNPSGFTFQPVSVNSTFVMPAIAPFDAVTMNSSVNSITLTPQQILQGAGIVAQNGQPNAAPGVGVQLQQNTGGVGNTVGWTQSAGQTVNDPVDPVSGGFYVDTVDLTLPGPFPLQLRRNYLSQNLSGNEFGYGWKINFTPYLVVTTNTLGQSIIYAAELDGTVIAYHLTNSVWRVFPQDNPTLNNHSSYGTGSEANLFNSVLNTNNGTNYVVSAPDGSTRTYQVMSFAITSGTNVMNRTRPYLTQWQDHAGNNAQFFYGANSLANDYGQLNRINMANGNSFVFKYDFYGRIIQAIAGDGRFVNYTYDNYGDLTVVTLPDASQCQYQYQHYTFATNGTTYTDSTHLMIQEIKPNGRIVANNYDNLRRVTNQLASVGTNLTLVTNAYFYYTNNVTSLTNQFASGTTRVEDFFHNPTLYYYTNNMITNTVDPLGFSTVQVWYPDTATNYPRSLQYTVDKRGLTNQFFYDTNGNVTQMVMLGNLTGEGVPNQSATNSYTYNTNNLPLTMTDPVGNGTQFTYDATDPFKMTAEVRTGGGTAMSTNLYYYTNVSSVSTIGTTNFAYGLRWREVKAGATNDSTFDGRGFKTQEIQYTATTDNPSDTDPSVVTYFSYNERGQLYQQQTAGGATVQTDFDPMGRTTARRVFDQNNNNLSQEYFYFNRNGQLEWYDGPRSIPEDYVYHVYDAAGREIQQINFRSQGRLDGGGVEAPAGNALYSTSFRTFDGFGNQTSVTDPRGVVTTNLFDALGRVLQRQVLETNGTVLKTEKFAYEPGDLVTVTTNALGGTNQTLYTQTGKPFRSIGPDGATNGWTYYLDGRPKRQYLANGSFWQTTYDDVNLLATRTFYSSGGASLATNVAGLDKRGNTILKIDEAGNPFTNTYDGLDRIKFTAGPSITFTNPPGTPTLPGGGNPPPVQQTSTMYYDAAGLATTNVNALGEKTVTLLDCLARVTNTSIYDGSNNLVRITTTAYSADHQSQTVTKGSGATAVTSTVYTDNQGKPVLSISYPSPGVEEYVLSQYDLVENLVSQTHNTVNNGNVTQWTTTSFSYDGLNRMLSKTDRDGAVTSFTYDPAGNLTNQVMPGGLVWRAAYNSALQKQYDCDVGAGSSVTRSNSFTYNSITGLLQTSTDGRGVTCTHTYDPFLRPATNVYAGSLPEHNLTNSWTYDPRGLVTSIAESFASTSTGPSILVSRNYDAYSQLQGDNISINGGGFSTAGMSRDSAGRRTGLGFGGFGYGYMWRADGLLTSAGGGNYTYDTAGQLLTRTFSPKVVSITQRDGDGRPLTVSTTVNGSSALSENLTWTGDGLLASHTVVRPDFTDQRSYSYAPLSRRLTQEILGLHTNANWTNTFTYDGGTPSGPGVLTATGEAVGATNAVWNGGTDPFSRIGAETNSVAQRQAYGQVNGLATISLALDGNAMPVTVIGTNAQQWQSTLELLPGSHQLIASAQHPSTLYTAYATNTFTNNAADRIQDSYTADGELTSRVWLNGAGQTNRIETFTWDAKGRLHSVTNLDNNTNGYTWSAIYDGLGRRIQTTAIIVTNGVSLSSLPKTINQYFDPGFEFLEVAETDNGITTWKSYGPDANGTYGGMNGVGGLEGVTSGPQAASTIVSDIRGNGYAVYNAQQGSLTWFSSRVSGYGAVPDYRPLPLGSGAEVAAASAWRGKWADLTGLYWLGTRYYDAVSGHFLGADPLGHGSDPSLYTFCGGDPINLFDADGRHGQQSDPNGLGIDPRRADPTFRAVQNGLFAVEATIDGVWNFGVGLVGTSQYSTSAGLAPLENPLAQLGLYPQSSSTAQLQQAAGTWGGLGQNVLNSFGMPVGQHPVDTTIIEPISLSDNTLATRNQPSQMPVVIGEDMQNRVIPFAEQNGFAYYQPGPSLGSRAANMAANQAWLQNVISQGSTIIDLGPAPGRTYLSPYYQMESQTVNENSVPVISFYGFTPRR